MSDCDIYIYIHVVHRLVAVLCRYEAVIMMLMQVFYVIWLHVLCRYEAVVLLAMYVLYVVFMYFNERMEVWCVPLV